MQDQESGDLVPYSAPQPPALKLTASEIRADVNLIQEVLKAVMKKDVHYGTIPGTPKPTLYKPGAEKILMTFKLDAKPDVIEDLSTPDEIRYRVRMRVSHQITGNEIGWGVGECSSNETKYKWVAPVCDQEFSETPEDRRREKWTKKKGGEGVFKKKQIRPNLQDTANTVLKMAKKRALVDAALTCTGASDVFDQDIEDLPPELRQNVADRAARPPMPQPSPAPAATGPVTDPNEYYDQEPPEAAAPPAKTPPPAPRKALPRGAGRKMQAKFTAPCRGCKELMAEGSEIIYIAEGPDKGGYHVRCAQG